MNHLPIAFVPYLSGERLIAWVKANGLQIGAGFFLGVSATFGVATVVGWFL